MLSVIQSDHEKRAYCGKKITLIIMHMATWLVMMLLLTTSIVCADKQPTELDDLAAKYLPGKGKIEGFTRVGEVETFNRSSIWKRVGAITDAYLYNGFQMFASATFEGADGSKTLTCEIYRFSTPQEAFALYSSFRLPHYKYLDIGTEGYLANDTALTVLKSSFQIRVIGSYEGAEADLIKAATISLKQIKEEEPFPEELKLFPSEGLIPHSGRVILKDFLGRVDLTNVFSARYAVGDDTLTLHFRLDSKNQTVIAVRQFVGVGGSILEFNVDRGQQSFLGEHKDMGKVYSMFRGGILVVVTNFQEKADALELTERLLTAISEKKTD